MSPSFGVTPFSFRYCMPFATWAMYGAPFATTYFSLNQIPASVAAPVTILSSRICCRIAFVCGVPSDCAMSATFSLTALYCCTWMSGRYWVSSVTSSTLYRCSLGRFFPTPPRTSFTYWKYTSCRRVSGLPISATEPVSGVSSASLMVWPSMPGPVLIAATVGDAPGDAADGPSAGPDRQAPIASTAMAMKAMNRLRMLCPPPRLVRKWPCLHIRAQSAPNPGKPERLEHQEEDDQRSEDELVEHEHGDPAAPGAGRNEGDRRAQGLDDPWDEHQEEGAGDRAVDGADAADDDHRDVLDRRPEFELARRDVAEIRAVERAGRGRVEG